MAEQTYTVKAGDTLSKVASQFGVSLNQISGYKSGDPNKIGVGETLRIATQPPAPVNTVNATNLGQNQFVVPPVPPVTGYDGLIKSSQAAITTLTPEVDKGKTDIQTKYDRLGQLPTERADGYKESGVYDKQAEYNRMVNTINQKELGYQTRIDKIRNENPTGQLTEGQQIAIDKLGKDWAIEKAALSISAAFAKDDYTTAKQIVDDRIDAETEGLKNELEGLKFFYSENQDRLTDERKQILEFQIAQVEEEKAQKEEVLSQIGAIQLAAAENGAPADVIVGIGKATDLTTAITKAGSWVDQTIDRKGTSGGGSSLIDLAPEDERILAGAGFSTADIKDIQKSVAEFGIEATINALSTDAQKAAVRKVYNVAEGETMYTPEKINTAATMKKAQSWLKANFTEQEIIKKARDAGVGSRRFWFDKSDSEVLAEYLNSEKARQEYVDYLTETARSAGRLQE